jgi:hypothetical protein
MVRTAMLRISMSSAIRLVAGVLRFRKGVIVVASFTLESQKSHTVMAHAYPA